MFVDGGKSLGLAIGRDCGVRDREEELIVDNFAEDVTVEGPLDAGPYDAAIRGGDT